MDKIEKLIYVIYPSGLGGEFLSYVISNSIIDSNKNIATLNPELTDAWHGHCLFHFISDTLTAEDHINQQYIEKHNPDFSKWFVCKDHHRDKLYEFLLKEHPHTKIILLMPDSADEYFATLCVSKTNKLLDATEENLNKFLLHNYKEFFINGPTPRNWNHETHEILVDYQPYMEELKKTFFASKKWWRTELWPLVSSILNNGTFLKHNPNLADLVTDRVLEYNKDIEQLQPYINKFDTLVIPGNCYKLTPTEFFKHLSSKFDISPSDKIKETFQSWIDKNNAIVHYDHITNHSLNQVKYVI